LISNGAAFSLLASRVVSGRAAEIPLVATAGAERPGSPGGLTAGEVCWPGDPTQRVSRQTTEEPRTEAIRERMAGAEWSGGAQFNPRKPPARGGMCGQRQESGAQRGTRTAPSARSPCQTWSALIREVVGRFRRKRRDAPLKRNAAIPDSDAAWSSKLAPHTPCNSAAGNADRSSPV